MKTHIPEFKNMEEFYPFYLSQHVNSTNRRLHFIGTTLVIISTMLFLYFWNITFLLITPLLGYGFAWYGHFFYEKNKPATFKYPFLSLYGDYIMYFKTLIGTLDDDFKKYGIATS
jgi:hypothetical protein